MASEGSDQGPVGLLRSDVVAHLPHDEREATARERILDALETLHRPFDEDADPVHVTGSAVVVGRRGTVLHVHKRLGRWMQPGGHVDGGEGACDAALRESQEETGLALRHPADGPRLIHVDVHPAAKGHTHLDLRYLLLAPDADPSPPPGESPQVRWWSWEEAEELADTALQGALRVARIQPEARQFCACGGDGADVEAADGLVGATRPDEHDAARRTEDSARRTGLDAPIREMGHNGV